jgi:hypothetical protein
VLCLLLDALDRLRADIRQRRPIVGFVIDRMISPAESSPAGTSI